MKSTVDRMQHERLPSGRTAAGAVPIVQDPTPTTSSCCHSTPSRSCANRSLLDRQRFVVGAGSVTAYNPDQVQSSTAETVDGVAWECSASTRVYRWPLISRGRRVRQCVSSPTGASRTASAVRCVPRVSRRRRAMVGQRGACGERKLSAAWTSWQTVSTPSSPAICCSVPVSTDYLLPRRQSRWRTLEILEPRA